MKCRACGQEHSPRLTCDRAARMAAFHADKPAAKSVLVSKRVDTAVDTGVDTPAKRVDTPYRHKNVEARKEQMRKYAKAKRALAKVPK